jgi:dihydrofolate reductase
MTDASAGRAVGAMPGRGAAGCHFRAYATAEEINPAREEEGQMRRIIVSMWTTIDGYVAGPEDEMPWLALDEGMMEYEISLVSDAEALLLGRVTHSDFAGAWPGIAMDESEAPATRAYAQRVDAMPKIVVSRSGATAEWTNSSVVESLDTDTVTALKRGGDGDLVVYGSLSVIAALRAIDMIDEYQLLVHPTTIGTGKPLFPADQTPARLRLRSVEPFPSGVVLMCYSPASEPTDDDR